MGKPQPASTAKRRETEPSWNHFAEQAAVDTKCLIAEDDLPELSAEIAEARRQIERKLAATPPAREHINEQIEADAAKLRELDVAVAGEVLRWAATEFREASTLIRTALEKVSEQVIRLRSIDVAREQILGQRFEFSDPRTTSR